MLGWLLQRWFDRPDKKWKATGYRYTTDRTYDEARALAGRLRALSRDSAGQLAYSVAAALAEAPTLCQSPDCQMSGPHELTECCPGGEHLIGGPAEAPTPAREEGQ